MTIGVRAVQTDDDFHAFGKLLVEYEHALPPDLRHAGFEEELLDLPRRYGPPHAAFVSTIDGMPAGCIALSRFDGSTSVVQRLYVSPRYRKHGIARRLVTACIEAARASGSSRLVLDTDREQLQPAYALYLSFGFRECAPYGSVEYACPTFMELML